MYVGNVYKSHVNVVREGFKVDRSCRYLLCCRHESMSEAKRREREREVRWREREMEIMPS